MIHIVGIGYKDIPTQVIDIIHASDCIVTSQRLYERFSNYEVSSKVKDKICVINNVQDTISYLKENKDKLIILIASGDPLFYGIGRLVVEEIGKEHVTIHSEISSIQIAFSRIKESWNDAFLISLHGGFLRGKHRSFVIEDLPNIVKKNKKTAVLTDNANNPNAIARVLLDANFSDITMCVCQRLGYNDEEISCNNLYEIAKNTFKEPNVVIIINNKESIIINNSRKAPSVRESELKHKDGLITKDEVRGVILHKLELPYEGVFWDIGAGSGAVSIDVAIRNPHLRVYAIEKDYEQIEYIKENIEKFHIHNITVVNKSAPEALTLLPSPDRVFIGGSGGHLKDILSVIADKSSETVHIIISATMIESFNEALVCVNKLGLRVECSQIAVSRLMSISRGHFFKSQNPVFIIKAYK